MNLTQLSLTGVIAGTVLLAGAVTLLYLLKVRRQRVGLASAVLWQQALRETPPRLLGGRFRRLLAWLLSLLLVLLLWLASAGPATTVADDGRLHLFYLDASAWLQAEGAFDAARAALEADVARVPPASREVVLGGPSPASLAAPAEPAALLHARLADARPSTIPSGFERWLRQVSARRGQDAGIVVHYYGAAPVAERAATALPPGVTLIPAHLAEPVARNAGVVALGAAASWSGRWETVDVLVATDAVGMAPPGLEGLRFTLDDRAWAPPVAPRMEDDGVLLPDIPANGGVLRVQLVSADAFAADDSAALRLPLRTPLPIALGRNVPDMLVDVVQVDPSLQVVEPAQARVQVLAPGDAGRADLPALRLESPDAGAAFRFVAVDDADQDEIAAGLGALGLDRARTAALANELGRAVGVDVLEGSERAVQVWSTLFAADGSFVQSREMPVFVNRSLHWLAAESWWAPFAAAGTPLRQELLLQGLGQQPRLRARALGDQVMLPAAGTHAIAGQDLEVSLLDRQVTRGVAATATAAPADVATGPRWRWPGLAFAMLLLALGLLCLEWQLLQRGRMP